MNNIKKDFSNFQGKEKIEKEQEYFEGWYFKNTNLETSISFIPGISVKKGKKEAFIQIITEQYSWYLTYPISDFYYQANPFQIKIGNNSFSLEKLELEIHRKDLDIEGKLLYQGITPIKRTMYSPNIMGPFSYFPWMECNHAILSMKHLVEGFIKINGNNILFPKGIGYIEKDWGTSFPKSYCWGQANCFLNDGTANLFFSIADIPFNIFSFTGFICVFQLEEQEYRFTTYNGARIIKQISEEEKSLIKFQKGVYQLEIISSQKDKFTLKAPKNGQMKNHIQESINSEIVVNLFQNNLLLFSGKSKQAGLEFANQN